MFFIVADGGGTLLFFQFVVEGRAVANFGYLYFSGQKGLSLVWYAQWTEQI
jgi:hypothetical protein